MTDIRETLLLEVHHAIAAAAREAVAKLGRTNIPAPSSSRCGPLEPSVSAARGSLAVYPPTDSMGAQLSAPEADAIVGMSLSPDARSGLEKLFADAAAAAFFHFFCLLDGVADPEVQPVEGWRGAALAPRADERDVPMLHDDFFDSYWRYREVARRR